MNGSPSRLTVAICTRNRSAQLSQCLEALCAAEAPADWEVLVVLNDCSDDSAKAAARFAGRLPIVTAAEPRAGLSHARNRAVMAATGDSILWIDDDVRVRPGCLLAYGRALIDWPAAAILGGPINPVLLDDPARWLSAALPVIGAAYARTVVSQDGQPMRPEVVPFGANYLVRTAVQRRYRYDPNLGRAPIGWLRGGEEVDVLRRMLADGESGRWVAAAPVDHAIGRDRQTLDYIRDYYEGLGREAALTRSKTARRPRWRAGPDLLAIAVAELRYRVARLHQAPERWAVRLTKTAIRRGKWKAFYRS